MGIFRNRVSTIEKLNEFRVEYNVPNDVYLRLGPPLDRPEIPVFDQGTQEMPFALSSIIEGGIRFPLHPLIRECLNFWGLAPTQLNTNAYKVLTGSVRLNQLCEVEIGLAEVEECHTVSKASRVANSYYLRAIAGKSGLVNGLESSLKHTEGDFLWVSGNWEFGEGPNRQHSVPRVLGCPLCNALSNLDSLYSACIRFFSIITCSCCFQLGSDAFGFLGGERFGLGQPF